MWSGVASISAYCYSIVAKLGRITGILSIVFFLLSNPGHIKNASFQRNMLGAS
jgi:hypothetical protein